MFAQVQIQEPLSKAAPSLLAELHRLSEPEGQETVAEPVEEVVSVAPATPVDTSSSDEMSEDEFERLLDELHGSGAPSTNTPATPAATVSNSNDISDDEFESLLDELHGQGAFSPAVATANTKATGSTNSDEIDDDEFESLLDELHGKGQSPKAQPAIEEPKAAPVKAVTPVPAKKAEAKPVAAAAPVKSEAKVAPAKPAQAETTVRVDTKRLDQIMNMVGELVLVRNRLTSLGMTKEDEELTKAVSNLDAVTTDLQGAG